jgi:methylated-DNA-[protein]-cysteine S-methyltransferase
MGRRILLFDTAWGWCGASVSDRGVSALELPEPTLRKARDCPGRRLFGKGTTGQLGVRKFSLGIEPREVSRRMRLPLAGGLVRQVRRYFEGRLSMFDLELDWSGATEFQRRVWKALVKIPYGETLTYGELARRIGRPGVARAVGRAVGANPIPLIVPCHRVVAAGGGLGGYSAPGGVAVKRRLLDFETRAGARR